MEERHEGPIVGQHNGLTVIDCKGCGFYHLDPLPSEEAMAAMYESGEYYTREKPDYISTSVRDAAWWRAAYGRQLDEVAAALVIDRGTVTLLDIGCGPGMLLEAATARGWRCMGVEPSPTAAAHARSLGLDVVTGTVADIGASNKFAIAAEGRFDVVATTGVVEHVRAPGAVIADAHDLLAQHGLLLIGAPRDFSPLQLATGLPPWWIHHTHNNYFSRATLTALLERHGFRVIAETTSYPMEWFILEGLNYIDDDALGSKCHRRRIEFEARLGVEKTERLYRELARMEFGRDIIMVAERV